MTASEDAVAHIDRLMHAQGHALQAQDTARLAQSELADAPAGLATLALAIAQLADAVVGALDAQAQSVSDAHGLGYGDPQDA